jgi:hypothetical protein
MPRSHARSTHWFLRRRGSILEVELLASFHLPGDSNNWYDHFHERDLYTRSFAEKAQKLRKELGRDDLRPLLSKDITRKQLLLQSIVRPTKLLTRSPIVFLICLYVAIVYGCLYLWFITIPIVFEEKYGWWPHFTGLAYLGTGIGMVVSA